MPGGAQEGCHHWRREGTTTPGTRRPQSPPSPWARPNFVGHTLTNQASILRFIEDNWHLGRIDGSADVGSGTLTEMFNFSTSQGTDPVLLLDPLTGQPQT
jgi:phospholipase C